MSSKKSDPTNPFSSLSAASFPADRQKNAPKKSAKAPRSGAAPAPADDDAALFFQAVSASKPLAKDGDTLPSRTKSRSVKKAGGAAMPIPEPDARDVNGASQASGWDSDDENELARAFRNSFSPAPCQPQTKPTPPAAPIAPKAGDASAMLEAVGLVDADGESRAFFKAVPDVVPLAGKGREVPPEPLPVVPPQVVEENPLQDLVDGKVEFTLSGTDEFMEGHVVGLDLLTVGQLQARHYSPEAHIDLHGLNSEQAFHQLTGFFRNAYHKGVRTALVVTGRGLNSPNGTPVLRARVQEWFTKEPLRRVVLAFCTAKQEDGGTGALYVLLRKYRKNSGKIRWDTLPVDPDLFL